MYLPIVKHSVPDIPLPDIWVIANKRSPTSRHAT